MRLLFSKAVDVLGAVTVNRSVKTFPYYSYEVVKLLGIDIDYQLNFDKHIKNICRKASQQLSVLKRIGFFFN
jgi:hypothetical protein